MKKVFLKFIKNLLAISIIVVLSGFQNYNSLNAINNIKTVGEYKNDTLIDNMDTIKFGSYYIHNDIVKNKEPIEWIVIDKKDNEALLLSKYALDLKSYNNEKRNCTWETCSLRQWLNNDFYDIAFNDEEKNLIKTTKVINNEINPEYTEVSGGNDTNDRLFCLSINECIKYFGAGVSDASDTIRLTTRETDYLKGKDEVTNLDIDWSHDYCSFWLRSTGCSFDTASFVANNGGIFCCGDDVSCDEYYCVRPAMWVEY